MDHTNWHRQTDKPLFPNLLWSRPETKLGAGKLLIIGGQSQEFRHVSEIYGAAEKAGAGTIRVLMPDSTQKITQFLPNIEYAPSNSSGSFARSSLAELLDASQWADTVILGGDMGKNSETSLLLESYISKFSGRLVITSDALISLTVPSEQILNRLDTLLIITHDNLRKFAIELKFEKAITSQTEGAEMADQLLRLTSKFKADIVVQSNQIWSASQTQVASSSINNKDLTPSKLAAYTAVWYMQHPGKTFEAITTGIYCAIHDA